MELRKNLAMQTLYKRKRTNSKIETCAQKKLNLKELLKKYIILEHISMIFHLSQKQLAEKNNLVEKVEPIFLQVNCIKVSKVSFQTNENIITIFNNNNNR